MVATAVLGALLVRRASGAATVVGSRCGGLENYFILSPLAVMCRFQRYVFKAGQQLHLFSTADRLRPSIAVTLIHAITFVFVHTTRTVAGWPPMALLPSQSR